ncbi:peptidase C65 Otubain-domain-containing protein [Lipomyces arxii]|uniref:peptidase C65 Otubain-domain-containing protein n=1 Tax=Lipomyces arxii TaxID=56418 RepID=UPI0034CF6B8C
MSNSEIPNNVEYDPDELDDLTILRLTQQIKDDEAQKSPLVGDLKPMTELLDQYEDPLFRSKMKTLGSANASYRPVRGDGNCAWRAFAFRYFEILRELPKAQIEFEMTCLQSRTILLDMAGYSEAAYGDFLEETFTVFGKLSNMTINDLVVEFNNMEVSSAIIVHFRLLAAAYVKTHAEDYMPFIDDGDGVDIDSYCSRRIEAFAVEADHLALSALVNSLGVIDLGVVYMDRSANEEAVVHSFSPSEAMDLHPELWKIDLLYRPGHYDIFYR